MRILIWTKSFPPAIGGVETSVWHLANGLATRGGCEVVVMTDTPGFDDMRGPFEVIRCPSLRTLRRQAAAADVMHIAGPAVTAMATALAVGTPFVLEHHGYQFACPSGLLLQEPNGEICPGQYLQGSRADCRRCLSAGGVERAAIQVMAVMPLRRALASRAAAHVAITRYVATRLALPDATVIHYGLPDPGAAAPPAAQPLIAFVGRLVREKGIDLLLRAAAQAMEVVPDLHVRIVGDGPQRAGLERAVAADPRLERRVEFRGAVAAQHVESAVAGAWAMAMPSQWEEAAGLAAIEQLWRGRLVLAADIGGLAEIVGADGVLLPPRDDNAWASALVAVARDPSGCLAKAAQARANAARRFGLARFVDDHLAVYSRVQLR